MRKQKKKSKKARRIDWQSVLVGAIVDLVVGVILLLIGKLIN